MQVSPENNQILSIFGPNDLEDEGQCQPYLLGVESYSVQIWWNSMQYFLTYGADKAKMARFRVF